MKPLRVVDAAIIAATTVEAREGPRGRKNFNVHPALTDPVQRFLNVFQPGSYVRPHRHETDRWELFLLLEGEAAAVVFDEQGTITDHTVLHRGGARAVEVAGGVWHTLFVVGPDTMLFEVKPGPYRALNDKDFATWAPAEGTAEAAAALARWSAEVGALRRASDQGDQDRPASSSS
jgi:cupin fold WbuC family metalloprotein